MELKNSRVGVSWEGFDTAKKTVDFMPNLKLILPDDVAEVVVICKDKEGGRYQTVLSMDRDGKGWHTEMNNEPCAISEENPVARLIAQEYFNQCNETNGQGRYDYVLAETLASTHGVSKEFVLKASDKFRDEEGWRAINVKSSWSEHLISTVFQSYCCHWKLRYGNKKFRSNENIGIVSFDDMVISEVASEYFFKKPISTVLGGDEDMVVKCIKAMVNYAYINNFSEIRHDKIIKPLLDEITYE